jgi:hypothetical protein
MNEKQFQTLINDFLISSGMTPTAFGESALKDPNFVFDLEVGRSCSLKTVEKVKNYISAYPKKNALKRKAQ